MDVDGDEDEDVGVLPDGQPRRVYGEIDGQAVQGAAAVQTFANMQSEHMELTVVSTAPTQLRLPWACADPGARRAAPAFAPPFDRSRQPPGSAKRRCSATLRCVPRCALHRHRLAGHT